MVSAGQYILSLLQLALLALALGLSAVCLRRRLLPDWQGAPARLVESIVAVALLVWIAEALGIVGLLYAWALVAVALLVLAASAGPRVLSGGRGAGVSLGFPPRSAPTVRDRFRGGKQDAAPPRHPSPPPPAGGAETQGSPVAALVAIAVVALVFAYWGLTTADALGRGMFNFDSLWYHMPFAVEIAHSHSVTGLHYTETVFTNWFYPQNSELLHAVGILLTERDTLSLFLNFGWLALAFLAAWCIGRPYGQGPLSVVAVAILLASHTLVVREPGAAKNDIMAAALLLAAVAILVNWETYLTRVARRRGPPIAQGAAKRRPSTWGRAAVTGPASQYAPVAVAGLAAGLAAGTKVTVLAMVAALWVAVVVLAPGGRRVVAGGWFALPALAGGGFWYLRNLVVAGNPLPQVERLGPISLPHPEQLQSGRPDFSVAHYATDTGVWRDYFGPGLEHAFGALWPLVIGAAVAGAVLALLRGDRVVRWIGAVVLVGLLAYLFTPLSAAGPEGSPDAFRINLRFAIPPLLAGLALLPVALLRSSAASAGGTAAGAPHSAGRREAASEHMGEGRRDRTRGRNAWSLWGTWLTLGVTLLILIVTNRADAVLRDPDRLFGWAIALLFVLIPAALLWWRSHGARPGAVAAGFAVLALAVASIGYPIQRDYLEDRFANADPDRAIPGMGLDSAYRWARDVRDTRIGLAGTTAGFLQYGFYGTDLSNRVRYLGAEGPRGAFLPIPTCAEFRAAVDDAGLDYLVTAPFLNFIEPGNPVPSPEAGWLRGDPAVEPIDRSGPVTVWRVHGRLDPAACGPANAPLRRVPQQPG